MLGAKTSGKVDILFFQPVGLRQAREIGHFSHPIMLIPFPLILSSLNKNRENLHKDSFLLFFLVWENWPDGQQWFLIRDDFGCHNVYGGWCFWLWGDRAKAGKRPLMDSKAVQ